jgi:RNA polymerase sigma-70 factor (ECF subfamily)
MTDDEFQRLLSRAGDGDQDAFGDLWQLHNPPLVRVLRAMAGPAQAEDLASTVWVDVLRSLDRFRGTEDGFRGWLFTIARRRLIDLRRSEARRPQVPMDDIAERAGDAPDPASRAADREATDRALALIATLPPDQAEVVLLRVVAGLDVAQVAQVVGRRPGTVRVMAHRGLRRLAEDLAARSDVLDGGGV